MIAALSNSTTQFIQGGLALPKEHTEESSTKLDPLCGPTTPMVGIGLLGVIA